jgi:hypothetical protein
MTLSTGRGVTANDLLAFRRHVGGVASTSENPLNLVGVLRLEL